MSSTLVTPSPASTDDGPASAELHRLLAAQRVAFFADPFPGANGQMCISVDYTLVARTDLDAFVGHAEDMFADDLAGYANSPDCAGIITERHLERIESMLDEVHKSDACVVQLGGAGNRSTPRLPLSLVIDSPVDLRIMQEEIFGPILPVVTHDDLDAALAGINAGERPLGLYVYSDDAVVADHVLDRTTSGGVCINVCALQGALPSLGFGGIGNSGTGRHHGIDGFREFSNPRGVVVRGTDDIADAFLPPNGSLAEAVVEGAFAATSGSDAPAHDAR